MILCTVELTNFYKFLFKPTTNITFLPTNNHLSQTHNNRCEIFYQIYYVYKLSCYSSLIMIPTLFVRQNSLPLSNFFLRILLPSDLYEEQRMNDRYYDPTNQKLKFIISKKKKKKSWNSWDYESTLFYWAEIQSVGSPRHHIPKYEQLSMIDWLFVSTNNRGWKKSQKRKKGSRVFQGRTTRKYSTWINGPDWTEASRSFLIIYHLPRLRLRNTQ